VKVIKWVSMLFLGFVVFLYILGSGDLIDPNSYDGLSINEEWDNRAVCQTARMVIEYRFSKEKSNQLYNTKCTVTKVTGPLPGQFSIYDPYAVSWPNGVAARVFITSKGLKVSGVSERGVLVSWNAGHK